MPTPSGEGDRPTILFVDDNLSFLRAAEELLNDRGFRVVGHATTAHDAVAECRRLGPDVVLVDVWLGDDRGIALVNRLLAGRRPPRVLLTSSDPAAVTPEQLRLSGASGFVPNTSLPAAISADSSTPNQPTSPGEECGP